MKWPFGGFRWTRTRLVMLGCVSFLIGLLLARHGWATNWQIIAPCVIVLLVSVRKRSLLFLTLFALTLNVGILRGQITLRSYAPLLARMNQKVTLSGAIVDDAGYTDKKQTEFHLEHLQLVQGNRQTPIAGRLLIRGFPNTKLNRGDFITVSGTLRPTLGNQQGQISYGTINLLARKVSVLERLRRNFFAGVYSAIPDPEASLGLGFLVGTRSLLPDNLEKALAITGLTHIVAVSGYNLTILVRFARRLLVGYSKYFATAVSVALILGFMAVTGLSPSIFRAAIVAGLALAAWYYGRPMKAMMLILVSAVITAGINPGFLWFDIGWYLSFLAFFGVLVLAPTLSARIFHDNKPHAFWQLVIESGCAQIMTLPIIIFIFERASLIAFVANLLVLPLVPLGMLLTLIAGISGMLMPAIAGWISWPAVLLLRFNVTTIQRLAAIPWASKSVSLLPWELISLYTTILFVQAVMYLKVTRQNSKQLQKNSFLT